MSRVSGRAFFVYVLRSECSPRFYISISENPRQRLKQHNESGRGWTARYCPWVLTHVEEYPNYRAARQRDFSSPISHSSSNPITPVLRAFSQSRKEG